MRYMYAVEKHTIVMQLQLQLVQTFLKIIHDIEWVTTCDFKANSHLYM